MTKRQAVKTEESSPPPASNNEWGVYLLECSDGTFYCGVTNSMDNRLAAHNQGKGAKYTRGRLPATLIAFSGCRFEQGDALRHERRIKRLPRDKKAARIRLLASA
jgi:putative endonuclease